MTDDGMGFSFFEEICFTVDDEPFFNLSMDIGVDEDGYVRYIDQAIEYPGSREFRRDLSEATVISLVNKTYGRRRSK